MRGVRGMFRKEGGRRDGDDDDDDDDEDDEEDEENLRGSMLPDAYSGNNINERVRRGPDERRPSIDSRSTDASDMRSGIGGGSLMTDSLFGEGDPGKDSLSNVMAAQNIETSAGTNRLNRILSQQTNVGGKRRGGGGGGGGGAGAGGTARGAAGEHKERVADPRDPWQVARFCAQHVLPPLRVQPTSIGGALLESYPSTMLQETLACIPCKGFEQTTAVDLNALQYPNQYAAHKRKLALLTAANNTSKGRHKMRYVLICRSTNRPVASPETMNDSDHHHPHHHHHHHASGGGGKGYEETTDRADYATMFAAEDVSESIPMEDDSTTASQPPARVMETPKPAEAAAAAATETPQPDATTAAAAETQGGGGGEAETNGEGVAGTASGETTDAPIDELAKERASGPTSVDIVLDEEEEEEEEEVSSFPVLVCVTINSDGTGPEIRKLVPLDQLTTVQNLSSTVVQLAFRNGETLKLEFDPDGSSSMVNSSTVHSAEDLHPLTQQAKERFVWSLMQIHAMLCTSVVERNTHAVAGQKEYLPPLNVRNLDRADLQYVATVNGFLRDSEPLVELLERQRAYIDHDKQQAAAFQKTAVADGDEEKVMELEEMDALAYAIMMGNFHTRVSIFHSEAERKDAEEVLNSTDWSALLEGMEDMTAAGLSDRLGVLLQQRMRDLEAETCRRLIAWEDEKHIASTGRAQGKSAADDDEDRDTVDALALASLFKTLDSLDQDLAMMEDYLQEGAAAIKPLTDDCADIEEENRQLEQQWKSYEMLGTEMKRLLKGLDLQDESEDVLKSPASILKYDDDGQVDLDRSEHAFETIHKAGLALHEAIEYPIQAGGMHLKAVYERAEAMVGVTQGFCTSLAQIIVTIMEQIKADVVAGSDGGKVSKNDTHSMIAKKIRDTQRKFQSSLLGYIKLIEVLAQLRPEMLPALRDAYSEMVSEGILMKKRCKGYFQALPGRNTAYLNRVGKDIKDYVPHDESIRDERVSAPDIRNALNELLPVIAREAYFTSALFGPANKEQDGREKKRNFENTRAAVDKSTTNFRYYILRTCGIMADESNDGRSTSEMSVRGDPLLSLVASICLNEAMDSYIDREKKGGDHSLSLAYVRATILDLRKRADKQWVVWVEKQMEWIKTHDGVPLSGKRAGIFPSFARFPCYIDHVLICCREGRDDKYVPNIGQIKVINYYLQKLAACLLDSLKDCAQRETTDQQYAAKVMQMENSYFFTHSIKSRGAAVEALFTKQITKANAICKDSTDAYLGWMIKREFATLHELFSRVSKVRKEHGDKEVPNHVPKTQFVRTLSKEASRDVMKERIGSMYSRMGKHLSEEGGLIPIAWKALVKVLYEWFGRWEKLSTSIYRHTLDPSAVDVVKIAKAAGGHGTQRSSGGGNEFGFKSILALQNKGK
eukprot:scaffold2417_cov155-Amphora_coffeaeformis.AAC.3